MDLKIGDKIFVLFLEDLSCEVVYKVAEGEFLFDEWIDANDHFDVVVAGIDEDLDTVDLIYYEGIIYCVPREYFTVVPF